MNCFFCSIKDDLQNREDLLYEDENVFAMLDQDDAVKGHVLVVWKEHALNISDLSEVECKEFSGIVHRTEKELLQELRIGKSIILKSGGLESHFHFHIYPVSESVEWQEVKDLFDKNVAYIFDAGEKSAFVKKMRKRLHNN